MKKTRKIYEAIILTFDYVDSTKISKKLNFEQTADFYQIPLNIFTEVIIDHKGHPWKYIGDQIIVLYNVAETFLPISDLAFKCAVRLIKVSNEYISQLLQEKGIDNFSIRVAIDAGKLVPILLKRNEEYASDLVGVTINRLAKICSQAETNQILAGDNYFSLMHSSFRNGFTESKKKVENFENYKLWETNI